MPFVRTFTYMRDENYGEYGLRPDWMNENEVNALGPQSATHDILEHKIDNIGGAEGECMALGAWLYGRGLNHFTSFSSPAENMSGDLVTILSEVECGSRTMKSPGRTQKLEDDVAENEIAESLRLAFKSCLEYEGIGSNELKVLTKNALGWIRKGYRRAENYYWKKYDISGSSLVSLFLSLQQEIVKKSRFLEELDKLKVSVDLRNATYKVDCIEREIEYY